MNDLHRPIDRLDLMTAIAMGMLDAPVIALVRVRQVGKTTLARDVVSTWSGPSTVFDMEVAADRQSAGASA